MANLWDYLTQPSRANKPIDYGNYADETLYHATAVPRFIANSGKSVYDSFKRGVANPNVEDALNVAMGAMAGSFPFAPKGNSPSTLGMAFRRPKDVVYTQRGEFNPTAPTLKEDFGDNYDLYNLISRYHNKTWGTIDDPVIKHIDKGFKVPNIPGLDSYELNSYINNAKAMEIEKLQDRVNSELGVMNRYYPRPIQALTLEGKYAELYRDRRALDSALKPNLAIKKSLGLDKGTKTYITNNPDIKVVAKPKISDLAITQLPYKIEGNLNRMSLADMLMQATEKEAAIANKKVPDEQLHVFDDGHYWTQLKTQAQREAESEAMGNSTRMSIHDGKDLYSLRDKNGKSILTASFIPEWNTFDEVKTRFNNRDVLGEITKSSTPSDHEFYKYVMALKDKAKSNGQNK